MSHGTGDHQHGHHADSQHGHQHGHASEDVDVSTMFTAEYWDDRYRSRTALWSGAPNLRLVEHASGLPRGTALDVGCGEGADAIWLAVRGWQVTAVDVSAIALERAADAAASAGEEIARRLTWQQADALSWSPPERAYDLVSAQFVHLPPGEMASLQRRLAAAVRPGGSLLVVGHDTSDLHTTINRPNLPDLFFTPEQLAAELDPDEWEVVFAGTPERETVDSEGRTIMIRDAVLHAVRRQQR